MIGKLSGIIDSFTDKHIILDVRGVGYLVNVSLNTLTNAAQTGENISLLIDTHVREDAITLYGFMQEAEQEWFRLLNSVQGVGAKAAFAILAACPADRLAFIIVAQDKAALTQAEGVGPKLAARILTELKDKVGNLDLSPKSGGVSVDKSVEGNAPQGIENDAVSALINLGYARADAYSAVLKSRENSNDNLQDLIREALKLLSA